MSSKSAMAKEPCPSLRPPFVLEGDDLEKALREARRAAFGQAIARLQQMSSAAVATLGKVMVDQGAPASTRVRAAECIINHAAKAIEIEDIEARVVELERVAPQKPGRGM
jgi:hypothetical protein